MASSYFDSLQSFFQNLSLSGTGRKRDLPSCNGPPAPPPPLTDLGPVDKSPLDSKVYKVVRLSNGLRATLVSTCRHETKTTGGGRASSSTKGSGSSSSFQQEIENFNRTHLGIPVHKPNKEEKGAAKGVSPQDPQRSTPSSSSKAPKLTKCCGGPASICVVVGAGYFHDPKNTSGLAHFVEHLVFLGSKQHPEANKLFRKVYEGGGLSTGATTLSEHTTFRFACDSSAFEECVGILVDGLTNPLFREVDIRREIEAIDSEYGIKQTNDINRINDFLRSRAKTGHPFRTFYWGNETTLNQRDIRSRALDWKNRYYRANYMTVCIQAPMPMKQLEEFVVEHFSDIPSSPEGTKTPTEELLLHDSPYSPEEFETEYLVTPLSQITCLLVAWTLPPEFWKNYVNKPLEYIRLMLHNNAPGGLRQFLRQNGWMTEWENLNVSCCAKDHECRNAYCSHLNITIDLTDKGFREYREVVKALFSYLKMVSRGGVKERKFEEMKRTAAAKFHFQNWDEMIQSGVSIAESMLYVPPTDVLTAPTLFTKWCPDAVQQCVDFLKPRTANYTLVSCENAQLCKQTALPCKVQFAKRNIEEAFYKDLENIGVYPEFHLPPDGTFLAKEIDLVSGRGGDKVLGTVIKSNKLEVYHRNIKKSPRVTPRIPTAQYSVFFMSHVVSGHSSRIKQGVLECWIRLLNDRIFEQVNHQFDHLFRYDVGINDDGIWIHLEGPSCHLMELLTIVVRQIFDGGKSSSSAGIEENLKQDLIRRYTNETFDVEWLSMDMVTYLLQASHASLFEIRSEIKDISFEDDHFHRLIQKFKKRMLVSVELEGAVTKEDAAKIVSLFQGETPERIQYLRPAVLPQNIARATSLPLGTSRLCIKAVHPAYVTSVVRNFYQVDMREEQNGEFFVRTLYYLMRRRISHQLRTIEKLGYTVQCVPLSEGDSVGLLVTVMTHPHKFTTQLVDSRIDAFLLNFYSKCLKETEMRSYLKRVHNYDNDLLDELDKFYTDNLLKHGAHFRKLSVLLEGFFPGTRISKQKQRELRGQGDGDSRKNADDEDEMPERVIQLVYLVPVDEEQERKMKREGIHMISDVALYKREMLRLLPVTAD